MKKLKLLFRILFFVIASITVAKSVQAQNGDQILDGIGETGLSARYQFNGDVKDWSRNNQHGKINGTEISFVKDGRFGTVLSINGGSNSFVTIPGEVLTDIESLSLCGWVYLRSQASGQVLFDFGQTASNQSFAAYLGSDTGKSFILALSGKDNKITKITSPAIEENKWVFISIVIDVPAKSITTYIDGKPAGEMKNAPVNLNDVFQSASGKKKPLYLGKSPVAGLPALNGMIHDFRVYRVPLSVKQIEGIFHNAQRGIQADAVNTSAKKEEDLFVFPANTPQLYNAYLSTVEDVKVETEVGTLPRLPAYVGGTYRNKIKGPKVRVLWPAPTNNTTVLKSGDYTITGEVPGTDFRPKAFVTVHPPRQSVSSVSKLQPFPLNRVSLKPDKQNHQTKFLENRDKFIRTLANTDPNSFLYMFRHAFGQKQPAGSIPLGVWDSEDTKLRGHATGHYLSAIAQAYAGTGYDKALHENFRNKMEYMVNTLYQLSKLSGQPEKGGEAFVSDPAAVPFGPGKSGFDSDLSDSGIRNDYWNWGTGFISAYPPDQFIMLENGAKYGGQKNQIWAPYYTLHKILAGLVEVYEVSGNKKALDIASGMGDWVYARLSKLPAETRIKMWNTYIAGEFGGMNESMAHLYRITGKAKYLSTATLFDNIKVFYGDTAHTNGLAKNVDIFRGLHANQHIPQIVGSIEMYNASKNPEYFKIADNFWYKMVNDYMYSIGGVAGARNPANAECFVAQPSSLYENGFSEGGQNETCATYNMLKLTGDLFLVNQNPAFMDYYERGLYNHILASVAENSPANTYHVSLRPGSVKQFSNGDMTGFTCCNGTAIESSTKLQNSIYFKSEDNKSLYVNLYIPSTLNWTERKVTLIQSTNFPNDDQTALTISGNGKFDIQVRVPGWATKGFTVKINGVKQKLVAIPGTYLKLSRSWKNGDKIELQMPFQFHLDPVMDQQNIASLFYGPILLAAQETEPIKDWHKITLDAADISKSITGDPKTLHFNVGDVVFKPFYETYGRHSVYLDVTLK
ncbi:beta-L-arabinofuranosidase domain-containing protein [Pedobacter frigidisoli]|uniref:beta-L-arabinofuranosidase domain-containing protein n=1 Tax=Pedobacter frigidisoli TaxID=2530455 RepID=UPI0029315B18|nr:beta-L-arabinofuranosidase domain-containing protein [Pedobacter frigidisoli]